MLDHALDMAAMRGSREAVQFLLSVGAAIDAQPPGFYWVHDRGSPALHKAARGGMAEMMDYLLENGADPTIKDLRSDSTPAVWARHLNEREIAEILEAAQKRASNDGIDRGESADKCPRRHPLSQPSQRRCRNSGAGLEGSR